MTVLGSCEEHWTCSLGVLIIWVKFLELDLEFGGFSIIFIGSLAIQAAEGVFSLIFWPYSDCLVNEGGKMKGIEISAFSWVIQILVFLLLYSALSLADRVYIIMLE